MGQQWKFIFLHVLAVIGTEVALILLLDDDVKYIKNVLGRELMQVFLSLIMFKLQK